MRHLLVVSLLALCGSLASAGDTVALPVTVDLQDTAELAVVGPVPSLTLTAPPVGGGGVATVTDALTRLQYTSAVRAGKSRSIQAALMGTQPPPGTVLRITVTPPPGGAGTGACGTSAGPQTLGPVAVTIISGVGGCCTGVGALDGASMSYELSIGAVAQVEVSPPADLVVTFTITEAN